MSQRSIAVVGGLVVVALVVALSLRRGASPQPRTLARSVATSSETEDAPAATARDAAPEAAEARRVRDRKRAAIVAALRARDAGRPAAPTPSSTVPARATERGTRADDDDLPRGHYEASYIQERFRADMFPLLRQCYESALARKPDLAGKLVLSFAIVGDPSVGGVVESADFADDSDLKDAEMETCVRESLMTLTFDDPPEGGGIVTVRYPILFSPHDEPDAATSER